MAEDNLFHLKSCRDTLVKMDVDWNNLVTEILLAPDRADVDLQLKSSRILFRTADEALESMDVAASRLEDVQERDTWKTQVDERRKQFRSLQNEMKNAVTQRLDILSKQARLELVGEPSSRLDPKMVPGVRKYMKQEDIVQSSSQVTEDMARLTRNLARQVDQSGEAIRSLTTSSETLTKVTDEFHNMGSTIQQGGRLIDKYDRRQFTDKILITLAFAFFFLVCSYIVNKRMFGGFNWFSFFFEFFFPSNTIPEISVIESGASKRKIDL